MNRFARGALLLVPAGALACEHGGGGSPGINTDSVTISAGGSGDGTGGTGGAPPPSCLPGWWTDDGTPYPLSIDAAQQIPATGAGPFTLCAGVSHFYTVATPCPGWLAIDVREPPSGVASSFGAFDNDTNDLDLELTTDWTGDPLTSGPTFVSQVKSGAMHFEAIHRPVEVGTTNLIEVKHVAGADIEYVLEIRYLPTGTCTPASWICEATSGLQVKETTCAVEPKPSCPSPHVANVTVPTVLDGATPVSGWKVHTKAEEVVNVHHPTSAELAVLASRCQAACFAEWADTPSVAATCSSTGAFETPRLGETGSPGPEQRIAASRLDGSGIFTGESLSCDLSQTCCLHFDEGVCAATSRRVTPAKEPLGRRPEYVLQIGGDSEVEIETNLGTWTADLQGEVAYSLCAGGNASAACPFYLAAAHVEATQSPTLSLRCPDGSDLQVELSALELELRQPAFGIDAQGNSSVGFPAGALILDVVATIDDEPHRIGGPTTADVVFEADATHVSATGAFFGFDVPCGKGMSRVVATMDLESPATDPHEEQPPQVSIGIPSSVPCGSTPSLSATTSDPDADLASVRWFVDDVPLKAGLSSVKVTKAHTFRAVASDARGAASQASKSVTCN